MSEALTFGSVFAAIGGFDLGFERAGMVCKWQVEIDPFCQKLLAKHWPNVRRYGDIRECGKHNLEAVDVICGGFPCQDVSTAGKHQGFNGSRTSLWFQYARIIRELEPRWVVAENVPGLLSIDDGRTFGTILRNLAESGYDCEWSVIPAHAVGAPHRRDRIFIVAYPRHIRLQKTEPLETNNRESRWTDTVWTGTTGRSSIVADATGERLEVRPWIFANGSRSHAAIETSEQWIVEPNVGRVANGVPYRVDRLRALGNAVVPQLAEWLGRRIVAMRDAT